MNMLGLSKENKQERSECVWKKGREREDLFILVCFRICAVKIDRKGQNNKELTVHRGELIEIENSSKKWWRARNFRGEVGHVPHNIVEEIEIEKRPIVCTNISILRLFGKFIGVCLRLLLFFFFFRKRQHRIRQV